MSSRKTILKAVRFYRRSNGRPQKLGVLAGSFNPPTIAHEELVGAARFHVDEVLCVVPSVFPHKEYLGATLEQRLEMLAAAESMAHGSIATREKGLFIDITRECQAHYASGTRVYCICGRASAGSILAAEYGSAPVVGYLL